MILRVFDLIVLLSFVGTIPLAVILQHKVNYYWDFVTNLLKNDETADIYDFIVVGSGSSGAVLVNRLSKNNKVLLIEAGGDPLYHNSIPGFALELLHRPEVDWMHKTVPQNFSNQGMKDKISLWPRGKLLGGSSNLNYMLYVRGNPLDYDSWANITGDDGWKYEHILHYFKHGLDYNGKFKSNEKHYGQSAYGKLHVEAREWAPLHQYFVDAGKELGLQEVDLNAPQRSGIGKFEVTQKEGKRFGTFFAFLKDIQDRGNLRISRYSQAIKIKLDKNNRAVGVWYVRNGKKKFAKASKEVVVSAGTVDSPKLLMLSGIGPKSHLASKKIKPRIDLPVGQNLYDHVASMIMPLTIDKPFLSLIPERDMGIHTLIDYFFYGKGALTAPTAVYSQAFFCTSVAECQKGRDWPDIQLYFSSAGVYSNLGSDLSRGMGVSEKLIEYLKPDVGKDGIIFVPALLRPKSVGEITLKDKNPFSAPLINPNYLEHPDDVKALIEGIKIALKFAEKTKSFKELGVKLSERHYPGCEKYKLRTDEYWECYIRQWAFTLYHPIGTCRMGKVGDPKAVVDSKLRVLNTPNLRVADASIMPLIVSGNTNAPSIMIGEKAADMIREYWSQQFLICGKLDRLMDIDIDKKCFYSKLP